MCSFKSNFIHSGFIHTNPIQDSTQKMWTFSATVAVEKNKVDFAILMFRWHFRIACGLNI